MNAVRLHLRYDEDTRESRARVSAYISCVYPGQISSGMNQGTAGHLSTSFEPPLIVTREYSRNIIQNRYSIGMYLF